MLHSNIIVKIHTLHASQWLLIHLIFVQQQPPPSSAVAKAAAAAAAPTKKSKKVLITIKLNIVLQIISRELKVYVGVD